jgi:hypothetical protein
MIGGVMRLPLTLVLLLVGLGLAACGGEGNDGDTAPSPRTADQLRIGGDPLRETARTYCGGSGRLGDLARIVGLPVRTQSLNRIAMSYGERLAGQGPDDQRDRRAEAAYEGCLTGLQHKYAGR